MAKDKFASLRDQIRGFRENRELLSVETENNKKTQPLLVSAMKESGVHEDGVVIDPSDKSKGTAYVQQNESSEVWDEEQILDYLNKKVKGRGALKRKCQSLVFDVNKWDALVASKEVPPKVAKRFMVKPPNPAPFIRFGKKGDKSK